jgi:FkbM family methyltransferase
MLPNLNGKTKVLNSVRALFMNPLGEGFLHSCISSCGQATQIHKLAPNHYQYPKPTWRVAKRNGIHYRLDISDFLDWNIYFGLVEGEKELLYGLCKAGDTVIDIGTNLGETVLHFSRLVGERGSVVGFEADPRTYKKCEANLQLNQSKNIRLENFALAHQREKFRLYVDNEFNSGGNRILLGSPAQKKDFVEIEALPFDDYVEEKKLNRVDVIKIDVEGFEMRVLAGAERTIERFHPKLFIELDDQNLRANQNSARELVEWVGKFGYQMRSSATSETVTSASDFSNCHYDLICEWKK